MSEKKKQKEREKKPGPQADRLRIEGDWENAIENALLKKRPPGGWPKPKKRESPDFSDN